MRLASLGPIALCSSSEITMAQVMAGRVECLNERSHPELTIPYSGSANPL